MTSFDQVLQRLDGLADRPGLGWALAHCAQSIEYAVKGFPTSKGALFQKTIGRFVLRRFLKKGAMSHNLTAAIPGAQPIDPGTSLADGSQRLKEAIGAFRSHSGSFAPHFAYGPVERPDYETVQSLHVANHLAG